MKFKQLRVFYYSRNLGVDYFTPFPFLLARFLRIFYAIEYLYISDLKNKEKVYEWSSDNNEDSDDN
jgi:hypothetical protein